MDELLRLIADFDPLRPELVEMVNGYISPDMPVPGRKTPTGLGPYLNDHPNGFVQVIKEDVGEGLAPHQSTVTVELAVIHHDHIGAQALADLVEEKIIGNFMAQTHWVITDRSVEELGGATGIKLTASVQRARLFVRTR